MRSGAKISLPQFNKLQCFFYPYEMAMHADALHSHHYSSLDTRTLRPAFA